MSGVKKLFYGCLFAAVVIDAFLMIGGFVHGHFWFDNLPAAGAIYGFFSCVLIIFISRFISYIGLVKKESYYD